MEIVGVIWLIVAVLVQASMYTLFRRSRERVREMVDSRLGSVPKTNDRGEDIGEVVAILRYNESQMWRVMVVALILISLFALNSVLLALAPPSAEEWKSDWPSLLLLGAFFYLFLGATPWLILHYYLEEIRVITRNGILKLSPYSRNFFVRWDAIRSVRHVTLSRGSTFKLKTTKGSIGVPLSYPNIGEFESAIRQNVPESKWANTLKGNYSLLDRWT